jgi:hypothetical protein
MVHGTRDGGCVELTGYHAHRFQAIPLMISLTISNAVYAEDVVCSPSPQALPAVEFLHR